VIDQANDIALSVDPWRFQWHPEVWLLVAFLTGAFIYMVRVIGPKAVPIGEPVITRKNVYAFIGAMMTLWVASDWPLHDISEEYLYSAHMLQHMMLSYFLPPLALIATPPWLLRVLVGDGRLYTGLKFLTKPVIAGVLFNVVVIISHIPMVVNSSLDNGPLHYSLHALVVLLSLLMWMPVVGPFKELHMGPLAKCIYLFLQSIIPTLPAAWLTFAEGAVYNEYDIPVRVFGWSVTVDQQLAGGIMKLGGSTFLWTIVVYIFFKRFANGYGESQNYRRVDPSSDSSGDVLTTADVEREFAAVAAPPEDR
jgi:putative membrane protein|tara:strand:- start:1564 stop:2487 length:924 start_codon:yes stop_codon:yes gene_type:complete